MSLAAKSRLFGAKPALDAIPPGKPGCPLHRNAAAGRGGASAAYGWAPYASCNGASDRTFSGRAQPRRRAPDCGRCASWGSNGRVRLQWGAGGPEVALPACVPDSILDRPVAVMPDVAHAAVPAWGASRHICETEKGSGSVTYPAVVPPRASACAFGPPPDYTPDAGFPVFTCCGAGHSASSIHAHVATLVHCCEHTGPSRR